MSWFEWTDNNFRGLDINTLRVDQAFLNLTNERDKHLYLYSLSEECVKCPFRKIIKIASKNETIVRLDTARSLELRIFEHDQGPFVNASEVKKAYWSSVPELGQFGVYDLIIKESGAPHFYVAKDPVRTLPSLAFVALIVIVFYWICKGVNKFYTNRRANEQNDSTDNAHTASIEDREVSEPQSTKKRLKSLDIFRGVAIVLMIFVNSGGGHYWWIEHATWNGLHIADLVFPWFLFIMGVCIPMSVKSQVNRQTPLRDIVWKVVKRSIILFAIGLCLNTVWGATFQTIRIFGVLQRFGIAYLIVSLIYIALMSNATSAETRLQQIFYDIRIIWRQWIVFIGLVIFYLLVILLLNSPGCERGYLGPGGIHEHMQHDNCTGGIIGFIDRIILRENHLYQWARIRVVYNAQAFDPEGIFGCLMTCLQVFLGVQCGITLLVYSTPKEKLLRWLAWGISLGAVTALLTFFSVEDGFIPINKNLWSLSFVTITSSLAFLLLSLIYYLVDVKNNNSDFWTIFLYPGMNAIILYVGHSIFHQMWPFHWRLDVMNTHFILLLANVYTVIIWILISHYLYHKNIFFNI